MFRLPDKFLQNHLLFVLIQHYMYMLLYLLGIVQLLYM